MRERDGDEGWVFDGCRALEAAVHETTHQAWPLQTACSETPVGGKGKEREASEPRQSTEGTKSDRGARHPLAKYDRTMTRNSQQARVRKHERITTALQTVADAAPCVEEARSDAGRRVSDGC